MASEAAVVGVDGWQGRWVAAVLDGGRLAWQVHHTFGDVLSAHPGALTAVDMPIGTLDVGRRSDVAARQFLRDHGGPPQSVFLTPTSATVTAYESHADHARAMAERGDAPGTSIQAWNLIPAIVQVRDALAAHSDGVVVEAHPECSFRALAPTMGGASKKTGRGIGLRLRALAEVFAVDLAHAPPDVPADDLLDAAVLVWTAQRVLAGRHLTLPEDPEPGEPVIHV